ncbi:MAG TPA: PQQ-binding-like beta-propeller repeat protein [Acidimicrobiales bacterium]|nr:PQQ-binding-like beta-propeller repeat protein [Acidimicrobiales bacterium]
MLVLAAGLALAGGAGGGLVSAAAGAAAAPDAATPQDSVFGSDWPVYHHDALGSGVDPTGTDLTSASPAWTSPTLDGQLYGEPLVEAGRVIAATENDTVYALAADTGAVLWSTHLATPVPGGDLPCTDITPTVGVTSTPVIDPALGEVFVLADESLPGHQAAHHLFTLDLYTGLILRDTPADPPGSFPLYQLQRTALGLDDGEVLIGYGGNAGDCENAPAEVYHGWLVAVPEGSGPTRSFEVAADSGDSQGAIWMGGGAPVVDGAGDILFATGNSAFESQTDSYDYSDSVVELDASLDFLQSFAPSTWYSDNAADWDLGSSSPAVLSGGYVFQAGKSHTAYVLSQSSLGGVGGELNSAGFCLSHTVDGGSAVVGTTVYVPCTGGVIKTVVNTGVNPPTITSAWQTDTGAGGPPIVAGGLVWTIGGGTLYGLDESTGAASQSFPLGSESNDFPTPTVADGLLLAPSSTQVHAFDGPAGLPPAPSPPPPDANLIHVEVGAANGDLFDFVPDHDNGRVWNAYDATANAGGPAVAGTPSVVAAGGLLHAYVRSTAGHLLEYVDDGANGHLWNAYDLTVGSGGGAPVQGDPDAFYDTADGLVHVYVAGAGGDLTEYVNDNAGGHPWNAYDLSFGATGGAPVQGTPSAFRDPADGLIHVYARDDGDNLVEYDNGQLLGRPWNAWGLSVGASGGGPVTGNPSAFSLSADGLIHVYVPGPGGDLVEYDNGQLLGRPWNAWDLSFGASGGGTITGTPDALYDPADGLIHVYARDGGGNLVEYDNGNLGGHPWNAWGLSVGASGGGPVAGSPGALFDPVDGLLHVYVRAGTGDVTEYVDGNVGGQPWNAWDLTAGSAGPAAGLDPGAILVP